tara:strand:- start:138 stop:365 length:228 start_codon:yes stop_codon:yes gene_type:complete
MNAKAKYQKNCSDANDADIKTSEEYHAKRKVIKAKRDQGWDDYIEICDTARVAYELIEGDYEFDLQLLRDARKYI